MKFYINRTVEGTFDNIIECVIVALKAEGFGVLTDIDVRQTMKTKINLDFRPYRILGACNPALAHQALTAEDKIGTMLPCNIIVQQHENGEIEVAAIDPASSMQGIGNPALTQLAGLVAERLTRVIANF